MSEKRKSVKEINISGEMKESFLNYAMSVIVSRALPDVRDGLKPVQRRILYGMRELGNTHDKPHKKSARIVGEVMGKFHPHGDLSIYDAMVRMAQPFNYRHELVDGHGNFGSIDGDKAAAMRYTEARMTKLAGEMVRDIEKETVDYQDNYDGSEREPVVLPARFPNLLVNGTTGIAVGMATSIAPHNLGEVVDATIAYIENNDITIEELMEFVPGPDFPTGGIVMGAGQLRQGYETGKSIITVRAKAEVEQYKNRTDIVITEIPYALNKTTLIEKIVEVIKAKDSPIEGVRDLRDESNRNGIKIVLELRNDVNHDVILNNLYRYTPLQSSFSINMIALVNGQPQMLNLKQILAHYVDFQVEVTQRRTQFDLDKAEARMHILEGLLKALNDIDRAIEIIKAAKNPEEAREGLINYFEITEIQARAILDMRLQRLTGLEIEKINEEADDLLEKITNYRAILASEEIKLNIIKEELIDIKEKYANERRSEIDLISDLDIDNEDLIPVEDIVITVTNNGYIKRMKLENYRVQNRGGVGTSGIKVHEDDFVEHIAVTSTHDYHLFFTNKGRVYKLKGYQIREASRQSKGLPIVNYLDFDKDETLASFTSVKNFDDENSFLFFVTKRGIVKRTPVSAYKNIRNNGIIALNFKEDDELLTVGVTDGNKDVILGASNGKAIRFHEEDVRSMGRVASGVRGMRIDDGDEIIGAAVIDNEDEDILVITEKGYGKRTVANEYRRQNRGGRGVFTVRITEKNGKLVALRTVTEDEDLLVATDRGITIRTAINQISVTSRATQGVRIIRIEPERKVTSIALVPREDEIDEENELSNEEQVKISQEQLEIEANDVVPKAVEIPVEEEEKDKDQTQEDLFEE